MRSELLRFKQNLIWFMFLFHEHMVSKECNGHTLETWSYGDPCLNAFAFERSLPFAFEELSCYWICAQMACLSLIIWRALMLLYLKHMSKMSFIHILIWRAFHAITNMDKWAWIGTPWLVSELDKLLRGRWIIRMKWGWMNTPIVLSR